MSFSRPDSGSDAATTVAGLLGSCLRAAGAARVVGTASEGIAGIPGLGHVRIAEPQLATAVADAAGRLGPGPGVALLPGRRLRLSTQPGAAATSVVVTDPAELPALVAAWDVGTGLGAVELELALDLDAPAPDGAEPLRLDHTGGSPLVLGPELRGIGLVVLVGPGVRRAGRVEDLVEFARRAGSSVVNTWGAKGVLAWDDPLHGATAGLQAEDFALAGVRDAPVVLAVGLDRNEAPEVRWSGPQVIEVHPDQVGTLAMRWPDEPAPEPGRPPLYDALAAVVGPAYESSEVPLAAPRAARDLARVAARHGALVAADPGRAGFWVARTLPTPAGVEVVVPALATEGFAVAAGLVAGLDGRPSFAVVDAPMGPVSQALADLATAWAAPMVICEWGTSDSLPGAGAHRVLLEQAVAETGAVRVGVPVAVDDLDPLLDVAGPIVAWGGEPSAAPPTTESTDHRGNNHGK